MDNFKALVYKPFFIALSLFLFCSAWGGIVDLLIKAFSYTVSDWLNLFLGYYRDFHESLWGPLDEPARRIVEYLNDRLQNIGIEIDLNPWWKSFWTPQLCYAVAVAVAAQKRYRSWWFRAYCVLVGSLIFLPASMIASSWPLDSHSIWPMVILGIGFAMFHLLVDLWYDRVADQVGRPVALRYVLIAYPLGNLGIVFFLAASSTFVFGADSIFLSAIVQILMAVTLMGLRDLAGGLVGATFLDKSTESWGNKFTSYATTMHGFFVLAALAAALAVVVVGVHGSSRTTF